VPDERAGVYNRAGLLSRGWGALANTCKQCQKQWSGGALAVGLVGGDFRREIVYFGGSRVQYTHLGCFAARGGAGGGWTAFIRCQICGAFQIGQAVPVGLFGLGFAPGLIGLGFS
jgi:hypothetical protein